MPIPKEVQFIIKQLRKHDFEAYIVGGCVRDILRGFEPQDWDITTNAHPSEIQKIFPKSFYENKFLTVTVQTDSKNPRLKEVEITTFRSETRYTDKRHPDHISFAQTLEEDLSRRDFTINAMAIEIKNSESEIQDKNANFKIIDLFAGQEDLKNNLIRAVGKAEKRFSEDALRMMRAVRFAVTLEPEKIWQIEEKTFQAIQKNAHLLEFISKERVRDELMKIIMSPNGARGIEILRRTGLLHYIIPELEEGFGIEQNKHHIYQIYEHNLLSLNYACRNNFSKYVRLAALLHDVAKPRCKQGEGPNSTFYNHEIVGAKMTEKILRRLKFPKREIEKIVKLVRFHLFYYNVGEVGTSSVRRLLRQVGQEDMSELIQLRMSDRIGSGVPKAEPYKLRHLRYMIEKVSRDPISVKMLKVNGNDIMKILKIKPGPKVGKILTCLLGDVLGNPKKNNRTYLEKKITYLGQEMSEEELDRTFTRTKEAIEKIKQKKDEMTKKKYWVT